MKWGKQRQPYMVILLSKYPEIKEGSIWQHKKSKITLLEVLDVYGDIILGSYLDDDSACLFDKALFLQLFNPFIISVDNIHEKESE